METLILLLALTLTAGALFLMLHFMEMLIGRGSGDMWPDGSGTRLKIKKGLTEDSWEDRPTNEGKGHKEFFADDYQGFRTLPNEVGWLRIKKI